MYRRTDKTDILRIISEKSKLPNDEQKTYITEAFKKLGWNAACRDKTEIILQLQRAGEILLVLPKNMIPLVYHPGDPAPYLNCCDVQATDLDLTYYADVVSPKADTIQDVTD